MVWDGVLIFIASITAVVVWLRWNYGHWKKRSIPYVEPSIIFGNIKETILGKTNIAIISQNIYNAYPNEPAIGIFSMRTPILQIKDLDLIKAVMISDFNCFRNNGLSVSKESDPILGRNPFFMRDDEWRDTRKIQTHQHSTSKLKTLYGYVEEVKDELIVYLNNNVGRKFDAQDFCSKFTIDVVSSCVFGIKTNSFTDEITEFRKKSISILDNSWRIILWQMAPKLVEKLKIGILNKESNDYFYNLVKSVVEMRREKNLSRADFIQNLLNEKNEKFSLIDMTAQTMTFFIDGYATSSTEMGFMLYMLALHPEVQERLREEVNSQKLDFDTIHQLPYMNAVLCETMRLYPAAPSLNKECNQDTSITVKNKTYEFKVGDLIEIPVYAIHRDPKIFENPLHFDPDRFMADPNHPAFLAFGAGPRACLGSRFAKTQIKAAIAALVKNFKIVPGTNDRSMPTVNNNKSILITPDEEMSVKFEKL